MAGPYHRQHDARMKVTELFPTLLEKLTSDMDGFLALLPDAVVEFPYAAAAGLPARAEGKDAIRRHFHDVMKGVGFSHFRFDNLRSYPCAHPEAAWFEVHGTADLPEGKRYEQDYVFYLRTRDGLVAHFREYWNMVAILELLR